MIKADALAASERAQGELIFADLAVSEAEADLKAAEARLKKAKDRQRDAARDAILNQQIADSFDRGGRHAAEIETGRMNLRKYVSKRGPVDYIAIPGVKRETWEKLSVETQHSAMQHIKEREAKKEAEILAGYRDATGNWKPEYEHLAEEEPDYEAELILAAQEEERKRTENYEREVAAEAALAEANKPEEIEYRITMLGKRVPVKKRGKK